MGVGVGVSVCGCVYCACVDFDPIAPNGYVHRPRQHLVDLQQ